MSEEIKMSDLFDLPICQNESRHFKHVVYSKVTDGVLFSCHSNDTAKFACHAINNHDRLTEENKRLRECLSVFATMVMPTAGELYSQCDIAKQLLSELDGGK